METKKTIYIIEDSQLLAEIIAMQLKHSLDCDTVLFNNADQVMSQMELRQPDLLVLDYNFNETDLTYKNGLEFLKMFRKQYKVPVIVFSGQYDKTKMVNMIKHGANDYISKDEDDFMDRLTTSSQDIFKLLAAKKEVSLFQSKLKKLILLFVLFVTFGLTIVEYSGIF